MDSIDYYNRCASAYYDNTVELNMEQTLERFSELLPNSPAVLDLGCGSGRDSLYFIEKGFDVTALDGAEELCELAKIHIGQDVLCMKFDDIDFEEVFDGVWACASLLHVPQDKMDQILDKIIQSLKEDGIFYMSFKYGSFSGIRNQRYFTDFKTKTIKELLSRHNQLEIIDIYKTNDIRPGRENQEWINIFTRKNNR